MAKKKPSDFNKHPWGSVLQNSQSEVVAHNIMVILERTGNKFRKLNWVDYKQERQKDGNFTEGEKYYFDQVIGYCKSADTAKLFSAEWR
jgi:hypothetical protein